MILILPPNYRLTSSDFETLLDQLPEPYIWLGDLNAQNFLWGFSRSAARCRLIERFLTRKAYIPKYSPQYLHIDSAIGSAFLFPSVKWKVNSYPCGSNHFPTSLSYIGQNRSPSHKNFDETRANWNTFTETSKLKYTLITHLHIEDTTQLSGHIFLTPPKKFIPQVSGVLRNQRRPR